MRRTKPGLTLNAALVLALLVLGGLAVACGRTEAGAETSPPSSGASLQAPAPLSVEFVETDEGFLPPEVSASRGQVVNITFVNRGTAAHNFHVAEKNGSYEPRGLAQPGLVQPGETSKLTWQAPKEQGRFVFRCDIHPVHTGLITVR